MPTSTRRHAAIMFTDIVGYTALMGSDEERAFEVLRKNREIHTNFIERFKGTLIKEMGDGMLITFDLASDAVRCAIEIQKACKAEDIPLKIGIHEGEMVFDGNDVLGDGVNIASRIQDGALEGSIMLSEAVYRDIKNKTDIIAEFYKEEQFKNVDSRIRIYQIHNGQSEDRTGERRLQTRKYQFVKIKMRSWIILIVVIVAILIAGVSVWRSAGYLSGEESAEVKQLERSIAVLPFEYIGPDKGDQYLAEGVMTDIHSHLQKIEAFDVRSRTSVEQFRLNKPEMPQIASILNANFILEGSFQKMGEMARLSVKLYNARDDQLLWSQDFNEKWSDIFAVQAQVAKIVAMQLQATINQERKQLIDKVPTSEMLAYQYYLRARHFHNSFLLEGHNPIGHGIITGDTNRLKEAIQYYKNSINEDPKLAEAYTGLGFAIYNKPTNLNYFDETFQDSLLLLSEKALSINPNLDEAYLLKGLYYGEIKLDEKRALHNLERAIELNPNYSNAFLELGTQLLVNYFDYTRGFENLFKAARLDQSYVLGITYNTIAWGFMAVDFKDIANNYFDEWMKLKNDSVQYYVNQAFVAWSQKELQESVDLALKGYKLDKTDLGPVSFLAVRYSFLGDSEKANVFFDSEIYQKRIKNYLNVNGTHRYGYILWQNGKKGEARRYFEYQIKYCEEAIALNRPYGYRGAAHYDLVSTYAFLGQHEEAFLHLERLDEQHFYPAWLMSYFYLDPMLESIRTDQRFKEFLNNAESKFQRKHQEVEIWLDQNKEIHIQ